MKMKCPKCNSNLKKVEVTIEDIESKVWSNQCPKCDFFEFEKKTL